MTTPADLSQLPIPNWGMSCPQCGYPLRGLPTHRCPECGRNLDIPELVKPWTRLRAPRFDGTEDPLPDLGLACPDCDELWAGATGGHCPDCGRPMDVASLRPGPAWFEVTPELLGRLPGPMIESVLSAEEVPHLVRETHNPFVPGTWHLMLPSEFFFEFLYLVQEIHTRTQAERSVTGSKPWPCPACAEENPPGFDVCWSCQEPRGATPG
ncbi:MAG: hypothetical protein GY778_02550 [bacterium]|nr:hypothetical protein [bacterium]